MRSHSKVPDGTMHALIMAGIEEAATLGVSRLSLAAMPRDVRISKFWVIQGANCAGLRQFKLAFGPKTRPLYMAAPTRLHLALAGVDILLRIARPESGRRPPLPRALQKLQSGLSKLSIVGSD
ncbi:MAG: hypothetical protein AAFY31_11765, partial [Pseudomonadota bacterium]